MAKVISLHLSVIHSVHRGGGGLSQCMLGYHSPQTRQTPPGPGRPPRDQADTPQTRQTPPWDQADPPPTPQGPDTPPDQADTLPESRLQHMVYERPVRTLLECILVFFRVRRSTHLNQDFARRRTIAALSLTILPL